MNDCTSGPSETSIVPISKKYSSFMGRRVEGGYEREGKAGAQVTMVSQVEDMQGNSPGLRNCICGRVTRKTVAGINNMGS